MGCGCKERREKAKKHLAIAAERAKIVFDKAKAKLKQASQ